MRERARSWEEVYGLVTRGRNSGIVVVTEEIYAGARAVTGRGTA